MTAADSSALLIALAFAIAAATLAAVVYQLSLMRRQIELMQRQTGMFERQERTMNQRADLRLLSPFSEQAGAQSISVSIQNVGTRTARSFTLYIRTVKGRFVDFSAAGLERAACAVVPGAGYEAVAYDTTTGVVLPGRLSEWLGTLSVATGTGECMGDLVSYRIVYDDGVFPDYDGWAPLKKSP